MALSDTKNPPIAKCWKCGDWIRPTDEYEEESYFYTCGDCITTSVDTDTDQTGGETDA